MDPATFRQRLGLAQAVAKNSDISALSHRTSTISPFFTPLPRKCVRTRAGARREGWKGRRFHATVLPLEDLDDRRLPPVPE
jgi:hypothetical protein